MKNHVRAVPALFAITVAAAIMLTGCVPAGPPSLEDVAGEFADRVAPAWKTDVAGLYGQAAVVDDMVAVYAQDDADGMRLEVHDTKTGKLLWQHVASPGGAWGAPLFSETESVSRLNVIPTIQPFIVTRGTGDKARPVILFTERVLTDTNEFINADILHAADLRSGEELALTAPDYDQDETPYGEAETDDDGNVLLQAYSPFRLCGDGPLVCTEDANGGYYRIDVAALEVTNSRPEWDPSEAQRSREWGPGFVSDIDARDDDTTITRLEDGKDLWSTSATDLFGNRGTRPAEDVDFTNLGDLVLIQGYKDITPLAGLTETLDYDYADSRTLVAVDRDSGKVAWRLPGGDAHCVAVDGFPVTAKTDVIPVCHATGGFFSYSGDGKTLLDSEDPDVSIAGVNVADGSIAWEVPHAGDQAILIHGRQLDQVFSSGAAFAAVDATGAKKGKDGVVDLVTGEFHAAPAKAGYVCESERPGVKLKFQGSVFVSGANPVALEFPAGWFQFACDREGKPVKTWTTGAVRVAGIPAPEDRVIVVTETGLAGFAL